MDKNKVYVLLNREGLNFFRWLWLSTNLFVTVTFHDIEREMQRLPDGGTIDLLPEEYLLYKTLHIPRNNIHLHGAGPEKTIVNCDGVVCDEGQGISALQNLNIHSELSSKKGACIHVTLALDKGEKDDGAKEIAPDMP